jgi:hypothetical protein
MHDKKMTKFKKIQFGNISDTTERISVKSGCSAAFIFVLIQL